MLPEGWRTVPIGSVILSSQYGLNLAVDPEGTTPIIGMKDMVRGRVLNSGWGSVPLSDGERDRYLLRDGDILLNRTNSPDLVGKAARWDRDEEAVFPSYIVRFVLDLQQADPAFVNLCLNTADGQARLRQISTRGVSQANINPTTFKTAYQITLPPLPEQRRIAAVLDAWDTAIATAERLVRVNLAMRDNLEKQLVGEGEATKLTAIADVAFSGVDKRIVEGERQVRLCNYMDVLNNRRLFNSLPFNAGSATAAEVARFALRRDDVVFTKDSETASEIAEPACVAEDLENVVCGYHLAVARPREGYSGAFLTHAIRSPRLRQQFVRRANGAIRFGLTLGAINEVELPMPPYARQLLIADTLDCADIEATRYRKLIARLGEQKRGLMQQLLTGKLRVPASIDRLLPEKRLELVAAE